MLIDPKHLLQLAEIVDCGAFAEAAARLGTSQPALSRMVANLELRLGAPLFERHRKPAAPTDLGRALAGYGRTIRAASDQSSSVAAQMVHGDIGVIRVGAAPFTCDRFLSEMVARYLAGRPGVRILLTPEYVPMLEAKLLDGRLDLVIGPVSLVEDRTSLRVERLLEDRNVIVCRPLHPLLAKDPVVAADLESATWISHARDSTLHADMQMGLSAAGVDRLVFAFQSESAGAVITVLKHSDYLTVLPQSVVADRVAAGDVATLPFDLRGPARSIGLISPVRLTQSPAIVAFANAMRDEFAAVEAARRAGPTKPARRAAR